MYKEVRVIKYGRCIRTCIANQRNEQELVGVAQEVLQSTPVEELEGDKKPQHQLRRGKLLAC